MINPGSLMAHDGKSGELTAENQWSFVYGAPPNQPIMIIGCITIGNNGWLLIISYYYSYLKMIDIS